MGLHNSPSGVLYSITYRFAWLIIMGSGFDDWVYGHFFSITVNYSAIANLPTSQITRTCFILVLAPSVKLKVKVRVRVTLQLEVYRQSVHLGARPLETHDQSFFFNWTLAVVVLMQHPLWWEGFVSYEYAWPFVKCASRTWSMLLKFLPLALHTSPLSAQALQSGSCLSCVSYATTAAKPLERS
jgi:hypothetical protein